MRKHEDEAIAAWNRRAKVDAVQVRNDALEEAVTLCKRADHSAQIYAEKHEKEGDDKRARYWHGYGDGAAICARSISTELKSSPVAAMPPEVAG